MQNQLFSFQRKGFLLVDFLLTLGFCAQAQKSAPASTASQVSPSATPPATVIYASQLSQMSPQKQEYIKAHSSEFTIVADPVQIATPAKSSETFTTPDGQVFPGKAPAAMMNRPTLVKSTPQVTQPSQLPPSGKIYAPAPEVVGKKVTVTRAEFDKMDTEKQQYIQSHTEQFDIVD